MRPIGPCPECKWALLRCVCVRARARVCVCVGLGACVWPMRLHFPLRASALVYNATPQRGHGLPLTHGQADSVCKWKPAFPMKEAGKGARAGWAGQRWSGRWGRRRGGLGGANWSEQCIWFAGSTLNATGCCLPLLLMCLVVVIYPPLLGIAQVAVRFCASTLESGGKLVRCVLPSQSLSWFVVPLGIVQRAHCASCSKHHPLWPQSY